MDTPKYGNFSSSVDPQKLAATIEGLAAAVGSFLLFIGFFDVATETTLLVNINQLVTDVIVVTPLVVSMGGLCYTIFGAFRKAIVALTKKTDPAPALPQEPDTTV